MTNGSGTSEAPLTAERLLRDTLAIPQRIGELIDQVADSIERGIAQQEVGSIDFIVLSGSGDLYHAALGCERAFSQLAGIRTVAMPSMRLGLYMADCLNARSLVIQMSFSGKTARAVEAAGLARMAGARIWALTNDPRSALATLADWCLVKPDTGGNEAAGYPITMLMLYLAAIRIAELRGRVSTPIASALRDRLFTVGSDMQRTLDQCAASAQELASRFAAAAHVLFVASGPTFGTAVNGAARILEAAGINASAQDIEEWAHLERWVAETSSPSLLIAPMGRGRERAREILDAMRALGKSSVAVVSDEDGDLGSRASAWLPVRCSLPEIFAPLVYNLPGELFAHSLGAAAGAKPYRDGSPAYQRLGEIRWGGSIRRAIPPTDLGPGLLAER